MADLEKNRKDIDEAIGECVTALRKQRLYYDSLHYLDIKLMDPDKYYNRLKDWSRFKEPKDTSRRDAKKDLGVSLSLKVKAFFSDEAKKELSSKKAQAGILEKEYAKRHQERVSKNRDSFYQRQEANNDAVDQMRNLLKKRDLEQVLEYFQTALSNDVFTLDIANPDEIYKIEAIVDSYFQQKGELSYSYRIPNPEEVCVIQKFFYDEESKRIEPRELDKKRAKNIRIKIARALLLRSAILVYNSDAYACIDTLKITGFLSFYDRAYGNTQRVDVIKVTITRDMIKQLNPEKLSLEELFERVLEEKVDKGLYVNKPYELKK